MNTLLLLLSLIILIITPFFFLKLQQISFILFYNFTFWLSKISAVKHYHSELFMKSRYNFTIVLLVQICLIYLFIIPAFNLFVLNPSFFAKLRICLGCNAKLRSQKIVVASKIALTIQIVLLFNSSCYHTLLAFTA